MSHNSFGHLFRVTSWGESHGPAIGCVIDGVPPRIALTEADIQYYLDQRRPGQNRFTTQRQEPDLVKILSGTYQGLTTGTPISLLIENIDARSKDYKAIENAYRPGHADYTYQMKYGIRDPRGGGRASARETATRVAAGAIARKILGENVKITGILTQIGDRTIDKARCSFDNIANNPFYCPDPIVAQQWEEDLDKIRKSGSSIGAVIEITASGVIAGLGAPIYGKLDSDIASALMSINAVKGVEIGDGFGVAKLHGSDNADEISSDGQNHIFHSNHAGGILGGISTGQDIIARFAVKPTSSINIAMNSITLDNQNTQIKTTGRHDPCVGIRAVPVGTAMMACVLADHLLRHRAQNG